MHHRVMRSVTLLAARKHARGDRSGGFAKYPTTQRINALESRWKVLGDNVTDSRNDFGHAITMSTCCGHLLDCAGSC
jgi:hypothetical protein